MRKISVVFVCLLAVLVISAFPTLADEVGRNQATFEGVLRKHPKFIYTYYIKCFGTGQTCALRDSDALEKITPGSRIRVEGHLGTFHYGGGTKDNPSPFPSAWVMYMDIAKVTVLFRAEPEQLIKSPTPLNRLPRLSLNGYTGDLGSKYVENIITAQEVNRVIVLNNETSAPEDVHLGTIEKVLKANPVIKSFYYIDPNTGNRTRSYKAEIDAFFTALLLTKDGQCVGFDVSREKVRIFNSEGDGWVLRDSVQSRYGSTIEPLPHDRVQEMFDRIDQNEKIDLKLVYQSLIGPQYTLRAYAARYLGTHGDNTSIPYLIHALGDESIHVGADYPKAGMATTRYWANDSLKKLTGKDFGFVWNDSREKRDKAIERWGKWYYK